MKTISVYDLIKQLNEEYPIYNVHNELEGNRLSYVIIIFDDDGDFYRITYGTDLFWFKDEDFIHINADFFRGTDWDRDDTWDTIEHLLEDSLQVRNEDLQQGE